MSEVLEAVLVIMVIPIGLVLGFLQCAWIYYQIKNLVMAVRCSRWYGKFKTTAETRK